MGKKCNFECADVEKPSEVLEFVGPVKIILVDQSKAAYALKTCYAAMIVMAQMLMATTAIIVMFYSLSYKRSTCFVALHIFLCTVGLQAIIPSGVLTLNTLNGTSAPMKTSDRKFEHIFTQIVGLSCSISGATISYFAGFPCFFTLHSYLGIAAISFANICAMTGLLFCGFGAELIPLKQYGFCRRVLYTIHKLSGIFSLLLSPVCLISGIIKPPFLKWLPLNEMFYFTIIFCVFYTCVIVYKPLKELF